MTKYRLLTADVLARLVRDDAAPPLLVSTDPGAPWPAQVDVLTIAGGALAVNVALGSVIGGRRAGVCLSGDAARPGLDALSHDAAALGRGRALPVWILSTQGEEAVQAFLRGGGKVLLVAREQDAGAGGDESIHVVIVLDEPSEQSPPRVSGRSSGSSMFVALPGARTTAVAAGQAADAAGQSVEVVSLDVLPPQDWTPVVELASNVDRVVVVSPAGPAAGAAHWLADEIERRAGLKRAPFAAVGLDAPSILAGAIG